MATSYGMGQLRFNRDFEYKRDLNSNPSSPSYKIRSIPVQNNTSESEFYRDMIIENNTEFDVDRIYVDNVIQLYVYHYVNVNLSDDDGDEHFIYFIDRINKKYAMYQFIKKDGGKWIKKL